MTCPQEFPFHHQTSGIWALRILKVGFGCHFNRIWWLQVYRSHIGLFLFLSSTQPRFLHYSGTHLVPLPQFDRLEVERLPA